MHYFDPNVAAEHGIAEAVIINHFQFWIKNNKRNGRNENDGRTWTYQSTKAICESFPYLSPKQVWSAIDRLVKGGVLMKGNYNPHPYDRTLWYAFTLEDFWIKPEGEFHFPRKENGDHHEGEPIPDDSTDNFTNNEQIPAGKPAGPPPPPGKEKKRERKAPGAGDVNWQRWVDRYDQHVKKNNNDTPHRWDGAQLGPQGLKGIRAHLVKISTKFEGKSDDDCGYGAWCFVLDHWEKIDDDWLRGQFDLTVLLKKITDILNRIKNATNANRGTNTNGVKAGTSQARVDAIASY